MNKEHGRLRRLVLGWEDLSDSERAQADNHLLSCADCRSLRERILAVEAIVRDVSILPDAVQPLAGAEPDLLTEARASRDALLGPGPAGSRFGLRTMLPLALAAVIAAAFIIPRLNDRSPIRDLQVGSPLVLRGDLEAPAAMPHGVSFRLTQAGYPVVVHVDGAGTPRLIHPAPGAAADLVATDRLLLLPPPSAGSAWRNGLAEGCESYLLAVVPAASPPPLAELADLDDVSVLASREETIGRLRERLARWPGAVVRIDGPGCD